MEAATTAPAEVAPAAAMLAVAAAEAARKKKGRPTKGSRPKIDIDDEIAQANRMAEVTKKMMMAARAAQRNSRRAKQRLVRRAGKLSSADLERLAVLKRCGLYIEQPDSGSAESSSVASSAASSSASSGSPPSGPSASNVKLLTAMGKVDGAAELLSSFGSYAGCDGGSTAASGSASSAAGTPIVSALPRGRRLGPAPPAVAGPASLPLAALAGTSACLDRADEADDDDMAGEEDES